MNLLDIIIIAIIAFFVISGMVRGSFTSILATIGFAGAWFGAIYFYPTVANMALSNQTLMAVLTQYLEPESFFQTHTQAVTAVADVVSGGESAIQSAIGSLSSNLSIISNAFEANVRSQAFQNLNISTLADYLDQTIWQSVFNVGAFILCFVALYILASLIVNLLDHVICFPLFRGFDWLLGGAFGFVRGLVITLLVLAVVPPIIGIISPELTESLKTGSVFYSMITQLDFGVGDLVRNLMGV